MVTTSGSCIFVCPVAFGDEPPQAAPALVHPVDEPTAPSQNPNICIDLPMIPTPEYLSQICRWSYKIETETTRLVNEVIMQEDFNSDDLKGFNAHSENLRFNRTNNPNSKSLLDHFQTTDVTIDVPSGDKNVPSQPFSVPGLYFRDLISVIQSAFTEPLSAKFHFSPFKLFQTVPNSEEVHRVYSELYNSDAFIQEHDKVQCMRGPS
ncbi:hypothetical protein BT96DRAFT_1008788 [Gymnopus androsaceus JB14]|uniref:Uncharacterized protein n=1 Tax=Gymnopus androsaceus JB14 TaxID=1447944 RepID=A0A6A4GE14_9AGAR|nr:hypothetical protein BT96DRAFT_1008788 [Gymnopus androsaceus JB14]